jgi:hypothetical protein
MGAAVNAEQWQQVKEAFQAALELPAEQRSVYLDGFCAAEPDLRDEIESLLFHYHAAGTLLENPPHFLNHFAGGRRSRPMAWAEDWPLSGDF